ncbi:MAG: protease modulator HflK [Bryobacterales bacterium]|nr:protease modulator HflK [Bryobacterales bacterium]
MSETDGQQLAPSTRAIYAAFDYVGTHKERILNALLVALLVGVLASGFHIVKKEQAGVVVRFGKVVENHTEPGMHYHIPLIDRVYVHPVKRIVSHRVASNDGGTVNFTILSGDPNLFEVDVVLQYTISNLRDFLYAAHAPLDLMTYITREQLVKIMGQNFIDLIFTTNREIIERHLLEETAAEIEAIGIGIELVALSIVDVRPIDETVDAFRDVSDAIAESIQAVSNANRRREKLILRSQGQAEALILAAQARARERELQAVSSADAFSELLAAYRQQPVQVAITRYWQRMQTIFADATLQAVNPAGVSTIDINLLEAAAPSRHAPTAADVIPAPADKPLVSTAPPRTHGLENVDQDRGLLDGQFHNPHSERDHPATANPRSLIFDALAIFRHSDVTERGEALLRQAETTPMVEGGPADEDEMPTAAHGAAAEPPAPIAVPEDAAPPPTNEQAGEEKGGSNEAPQQ